MGKLEEYFQCQELASNRSQLSLSTIGDEPGNFTELSHGESQIVNIILVSGHKNSGIMA
jgi:hypothetical protein